MLVHVAAQSGMFWLTSAFTGKCCSLALTSLPPVPVLTDRCCILDPPSPVSIHNVNWLVWFNPACLYPIPVFTSHLPVGAMNCRNPASPRPELVSIVTWPSLGCSPSQFLHSPSGLFPNRGVSPAPLCGHLPVADLTHTTRLLAQPELVYFLYQHLPADAVGPSGSHPF